MLNMGRLSLEEITGCLGKHVHHQALLQCIYMGSVVQKKRVPFIPYLHLIIFLIRVCTQSCIRRASPIHQSINRNRYRLIHTYVLTNQPPNCMNQVPRHAAKLWCGAAPPPRVTWKLVLCMHAWNQQCALHHNPRLNASCQVL